MARYPCAYCGRKRPAVDLIRSKHTGDRYCADDLARCERRAAKLKRQRKEGSDEIAPAPLAP